jgi:hypothetical protein
VELAYIIFFPFGAKIYEPKRCKGLEQEFIAGRLESSGTTNLRVKAEKEM